MEGSGLKPGRMGLRRGGIVGVLIDEFFILF